MFKKKLKLAVICCTVAFLLGFMGLSLNVLAEEKSPELKADRKAIEKGLDESLGMPVLKGDLWQKMTYDEKVAFIWGFGHVVSIEQYLMEKYPELKRESFAAKVVEGMDNTPMKEVVARVDRYYMMHPNEIDKPVTSVLWDTMIRPNIKTGIAGRPIKNK
ncbi:MAG TPA: hypothetical protein VLH56_07630 [Dissulfurispiraceae bacterium]|nr:hypothetical protein [Dissulfurispiraceae bacterium]